MQSQMYHFNLILNLFLFSCYTYLIADLHMCILPRMASPVLKICINCMKKKKKKQDRNVVGSAACT